MAMTLPLALAASARGRAASGVGSKKKWAKQKRVPFRWKRNPRSWVSCRSGKALCAFPKPALVERLDLHQAGVVIAADPEGHRRGRIVDEHRAHIGVLRHQVFDRLAGLRVVPHD